MNIKYREEQNDKVKEYLKNQGFRKKGTDEYVKYSRNQSRIHIKITKEKRRHGFLRLSIHRDSNLYMGSMHRTIHKDLGLEKLKKEMNRIVGRKHGAT